MDFAPPRGTQDLLPPRSATVRALMQEAARTAELYGYGYVETPALEHTEVVSRTSGESSDIVQKETYTFSDRGGRSLTMRPEGTAPVVRAFLAKAHDLPTPFKAYYLAPMWRYGRPQSGRYREFRHFGIEAIGAAEPVADVEVIAVGDRYLRGLGLGRLELQLNSIGDEVCRPAYREELLAYLETRRDQLRDEHRERFARNPLRVLDCKDAACREVAAGAPKIADRLCEPCATHFEGVRQGLDAEGVGFTPAPTLVRGLDYYTRTAFEWVSAALAEGQNAVGGGGRYDGLAEVLGGPPTPGVGWALGIERIVLALEHEDGDLPGRSGPDCFVVAVGEAAGDAAARAARALREAGVSAAAGFEPRSLKAQLRMADRSGARFAVIVGEREEAAGTVTLRRLSDGHQEEFGMDEAITWITTQDEGPS